MHKNGRPISKNVEVRSRNKKPLVSSNLELSFHDKQRSLLSSFPVNL